MSYAVMLVGVLMVIGGGVFAYHTAGDGLGQGLILGAIIASLGVVVIALGRINESISEQTDYLIEKMGTESKQAKKVNGKLVEDIDEYDDDERKIKG